MGRNISVGQLADEVEKITTMYHADVVEKLNDVAKETMKELVNETKAFRFAQDTGRYRKDIASRVLEKTPDSITYQWYVKSPSHRLSHLLNNGHATANGGRTRAYRFLDTAERNAIERFEQKTIEVLTNE